jgi:[ribosomal protein S5]-alanine N-acetyltransferase
MINLALYERVPYFKLSNGLILRELSVHDAPAYLNYMRNPNVGRYVLVEKEATLSYATAHVNYCKSMARHQAGIFWGVVDEATNTMVGWIGFYANNANRRAEIAYDLAEPYWGQGIMSDAVATVTRFLFHAGFVRVTGLLLKENLGSVRVLEKNGYRFEGSMRNYKYFRDKAYDIEAYTITVEDHRAQHPHHADAPGSEAHTANTSNDDEADNQALASLAEQVEA